MRYDDADGSELMAGKSRGRGLTALVGWLLLCGGVVGAIALVIAGERQFDEGVDTLARAHAGCSTTLRFTDAGTFYVYEETYTSADPPEPVVSSPTAEACTPAGAPGSEFSFVLLDGDGTEVRTVRDRSVSYDGDGLSGESYATFDVISRATVDIVVTGADINTVAAVGRSPEAPRAEMRRTAAIVGVAGVVLGALLLILSGRRSRHAAVAGVPDGPGWSRPIPAAPPVYWPPATPNVSGLGPGTAQTPVNPHMPDKPVGAADPGQPWSAPISGLRVPPLAEPLPKRLIPPSAPSESLPPSESTHDGDDSTED
ncbi:MAG TPA: hypothetical protein VMM60_18870 [Ilumatobacter sp.]|nr:hypothetical protein [Ilumatobacter sp.]